MFRSGIDPNFAVLSFRAPTLSATSINGNTFGTFFLHKFTTSVWDLDHVFLGGHTQILRERSTTTNEPYINFRTFLNGTYDGNQTILSVLLEVQSMDMLKYYYNNMIKDNNI